MRRACLWRRLLGTKLYRLPPPVEPSRPGESHPEPLRGPRRVGDDHVVSAANGRLFSIARYRDAERATGGPSCGVDASAALPPGRQYCPSRRRVRSTFRAPARRCRRAGDRPYLDTYANIDKAGGNASPLSHCQECRRARFSIKSRRTDSWSAVRDDVRYQ